MAAGGLQIEISSRDWQRLRTELSGITNGVARAATAAINRTATQVRRGALREVARESGVTQREAGENVRLVKANYRKLNATVRLSAKTTPLIRHKAKQTAKGVTFKPGAGQPRRLIPGAFIAVMPTGHRGVFKRRSITRRVVRQSGTKRWSSALPIAEQFAPSLLSKLIEKGVIAKLEADAGKLLAHNVDGQIRRLLDRQAAKEASA